MVLMKKFPSVRGVPVGRGVFRAFIVASLFLGCTQIERDNPYDENGNYTPPFIPEPEPEPSSSSYVPSSCPNPSVSGDLLSCGGQTYRTVNINGQVWMAENLNYDASGSKCYSNGSSNCNTYGRLYNWETANKVCPDGWHLPSDSEWTELTDYVGSGAGTKLKATTGWNSGGNGTDTYGFSALPGGFGFSVGFFFDAGYFGYWWSATEYNSSLAWYRGMYYNDGYVGRNGYIKSYLFSVRCLKDGFSAPSSSSSVPSSSSLGVVYGDPVTYGGETYETVVIGTQTWFARNLNYDPGTGTSACYDCAAYGRLYDWETALTVCPDGWHLPSDSEWTTLTDYVGSDAGTKLKATTGWNSGGNGTDTYGFSALPGGLGRSGGSFYGAGGNGYWWSATEYDSHDAWLRLMYYGSSGVGRSINDKSYLFSVRCLKG